MHNIITSLAGKYGLTKAEVMAEVEAVFAAQLSQWYCLPVMAFFRDDLRLEAVVYNSTGGVVMQRLVELSEIKGRGTPKKQIEANLTKAAVLKQTARYKFYEKELLWSEITACDPEQNLYVVTEVMPGEWVTAICPANRPFICAGWRAGAAAWHAMPQCRGGPGVQDPGRNLAPQSAWA
jgi:hypothetical protein